MFVRVRVYVFLRQPEIHYVQSFVFFHTRPAINTRFISAWYSSLKVRLLGV